MTDSFKKGRPQRSITACARRFSSRWQKGAARILAMGMMITLSACTYGPEESTAHITNVAMRPGTHDLAFAINFRRFRDATGINAFPNGGNPLVIEREARIYICHLNQGLLRKLASVPDYNGIPSGESVWVVGWKGSDLYFRLHGYERGVYGGQDTDRPTRYFYRVSEDGELSSVSELPSDLATQTNSGAAGAPPFLRYSRGFRDIEIAIDGLISERGVDARVIFPEGSAEPVLERLK